MAALPAAARSRLPRRSKSTTASFDPTNEFFYDTTAVATMEAAKAGSSTDATLGSETTPLQKPPKQRNKRVSVDGVPAPVAKKKGKSDPVADQLAKLLAGAQEGSGGALEEYPGGGEASEGGMEGVGASS